MSVQLKVPRRRRTVGLRGRPLVLLSLVALTACATPSSDAGDARGATMVPAPPGGVSRAANDLRVEVEPGDGSAPETWTLTCAGVAAGSHPDAGAACAHLEGLDEPFVPLPADAMCTEQYGGPQTARVTGLWAGEPVDLGLSRVDGCAISQWDRLGPLLPAPAAFDVPD